MRAWVLTALTIWASPGSESHQADYDGDGVADTMDDCPTDPGQSTTRPGCPDDAPPPATPDPPREPPATRIEGIRFKTGRAALTRSSHPGLARLADHLRRQPADTVIRVEGHTDNVGSTAHNRALSRRRAESVLAALVERGFARKRLVAVGYGPDRPVAPNDTSEGRAQNRRVEVRIVNK